ncbi:MAG: hypothetical protein VX265_15840 [Myxococcota bacterium]|nr:hypothetical protein [Myxococcota bacterium]
MRILTLALLAACAPDPATWRTGQDLRDLRFDPFTDDVGVHPDTSILDDPRNPFAAGFDPDSDLKWDINDSGCDRAVYSWATALAIQPMGESQFYTAGCMQALYEGGRVADEDLYLVWTLAVRGFEAVLAEFPDDVTYDVTGTIAYPLAPLAEQALLDLGATQPDREAAP